MLRSLLATVFAFSLMIGAASAKEETYVLDKPHTQIFFTVSHLGFSHSTGSFTDYAGTFKFDPENPTAGSTDVTIQTGSLNMGDATWKEHTEGKILEAAKYPTMTFKSTSVTKTGDKTADLVGDLTLHGVTKPVTLHVTLNKCEAHPMSKKPACGFDAEGTLKRSDFGVTEGVPFVSDEVQLRITVEGAAEVDAASAGQNE